MTETKRFSWLQNIDPGVLILPFLGLVFITMGLVFLYVLGQVHTLECTRDSGTNQICAINTTWMNLQDLSVRPVPQLTTAYVEDSCDDDGCTYRVMLSTRYGDMPITSIYSSGLAGKKKNVEKIRQFLLDDTQMELQISEGGGFWILLPLIFIAVGLFLCIPALTNIFKRNE